MHTHYTSVNHKDAHLYTAHSAAQSQTDKFRDKPLQTFKALPRYPSNKLFISISGKTTQPAINRRSASYTDQHHVCPPPLKLLSQRQQALLGLYIDIDTCSIVLGIFFIIRRFIWGVIRIEATETAWQEFGEGSPAFKFTKCGRGGGRRGLGRRLKSGLNRC